MELEVPRDRAGRFEPRLVEKSVPRARVPGAGQQCRQARNTPHCSGKEELSVPRIGGRRKGRFHRLYPHRDSQDERPRPSGLAPARFRTGRRPALDEGRIWPLGPPGPSSSSEMPAPATGKRLCAVSLPGERVRTALTRSESRRSTPPRAKGVAMRGDSRDVVEMSRGVAGAPSNPPLGVCPSTGAPEAHAGGACEIARAFGHDPTRRPADRGGVERSRPRARGPAPGATSRSVGPRTLSLERADSVKSRSPAAASYRSERGLDRGDAERV